MESLEAKLLAAQKSLGKSPFAPLRSVCTRLARTVKAAQSMPPVNFHPAQLWRGRGKLRLDFLSLEVILKSLKANRFIEDIEGTGMGCSSTWSK